MGELGDFLTGWAFRPSVVMAVHWGCLRLRLGGCKMGDPSVGDVVRLQLIRELRRGDMAKTEQRDWRNELTTGRGTNSNLRIDIQSKMNWNGHITLLTYCFVYIYCVL